jgi:tripartite-type tricarboxylate transporter receptor subunit TctC
MAAAWSFAAEAALAADPASQDSSPVWPTRPATIVGPSAAAISTDLLARAVAAAFGDEPGHQFVVE